MEQLLLIIESLIIMIKPRLVVLLSLTEQPHRSRAQLGPTPLRLRLRHGVIKGRKTSIRGVRAQRDLGHDGQHPFMTQTGN